MPVPLKVEPFGGVLVKRATKSIRPLFYSWALIVSFELDASLGLPVQSCIPDDEPLHKNRVYGRVDRILEAIHETQPHEALAYQWDNHLGSRITMRVHSKL